MTLLSLKLAEVLRRGSDAFGLSCFRDVVSGDGLSCILKRLNNDPLSASAAFELADI